MATKKKSPSEKKGARPRRSTGRSKTADTGTRPNADDVPTVESTGHVADEAMTKKRPASAAAARRGRGGKKVTEASTSPPAESRFQTADVENDIIAKAEAPVAPRIERIDNTVVFRFPPVAPPPFALPEKPLPQPKIEKRPEQKVEIARPDRPVEPAFAGDEDDDVRTAFVRGADAVTDADVGAGGGESEGDSASTAAAHGMTEEEFRKLSPSQKRRLRRKRRRDAVGSQSAPPRPVPRPAAPAMRPPSENRDERGDRGPRADRPDRGERRDTRDQRGNNPGDGGAGVPVVGGVERRDVPGRSPESRGRDRDRGRAERSGRSDRREFGPRRDNDRGPRVDRPGGEPRFDRNDRNNRNDRGPRNDRNDRGGRRDRDQRGGREDSRRFRDAPPQSRQEPQRPNESDFGRRGFAPETPSRTREEDDREELLGEDAELIDSLDRDEGNEMVIEAEGPAEAILDDTDLVQGVELREDETADDEEEGEEGSESTGDVDTDTLERVEGRGDRGRRGRRGGRRRENRYDRERPTEIQMPPEPERTAAERAAAAAASRGTKEMVINAIPREECRIAILSNGKLEEIYMERASSENYVQNIYRGVVTNVEASIQAAFIDFGQGKNGFLHISDLHPMFFPDNASATESVGRKLPRKNRPPIQRCLRRGQELTVQVTKEGIGTKGPTLTTYLSIPGRFLVMMPGMRQLGVSRRIEDDGQRRQLRDILNKLELPDDMGFIARTAALSRTAEELQKDLNYLTRLWRTVENRLRREKVPCELYRESDLVTRTIRDVYTSDIARIVVDDPEVAERAREFLSIFDDRSDDIVVQYGDPQPIFHKHGIEAELDRLHSRHVPLRSGGSLVIDQTEALVAIDVNSGKFRTEDDAETTAFKINLEAADEISRQLRLRDLGGVIICDFIDMRMESHRREIERRLVNNLREHRERAKVLRMSAFGIIELTRQRQRASLQRSVYQDCVHCRGTGLVKTAESVSLDIMRLIQLAVTREHVASIDISVCGEVAYMIQNRRRKTLYELESTSRKIIAVRAESGWGIEQFEIRCMDSRGRLVPYT